MNDLQKIIGEAPKGATHWDHLATWKYKNLDKGTFFVDDSGTGFKIDEFYPSEGISSLSDIRQIVELQAQNAELREALSEFVSRVEKGEVRSAYTYNKFKKLLGESE